MSWRDSLIRLSTYEVEILQQRLAVIAARKAEGEMRLAMLEAEGEAEMAHADRDAEAGFYLAGFRQGLKVRMGSVQREIDLASQEEAGARDALTEAFEALKKYQHIDAQAKVLERKAAGKREDQAMDEQGLRRAVAGR